MNIKYYYTYKIMERTNLLQDDSSKFNEKVRYYMLCDKRTLAEMLAVRDCQNESKKESKKEYEMIGDIISDPNTFRVHDYDPYPPYYRQKDNINWIYNDNTATFTKTLDSSPNDTTGYSSTCINDIKKCTINDNSTDTSDIGYTSTSVCYTPKDDEEIITMSCDTCDGEDKACTTWIDMSDREVPKVVNVYHSGVVTLGDDCKDVDNGYSTCATYTKLMSYDEALDYANKHKREKK